MLTPQINGGIKINAFLIYFDIPIFSAFLRIICDNVWFSSRILISDTVFLRYS